VSLHAEGLQQLLMAGMIPTSMACVLACALLATGAPPSYPTDNPVETMYGADAYQWTAAVNWSQVVSQLAEVFEWGDVCAIELGVH
jgi:hypothetical protein